METRNPLNARVWRLARNTQQVIHCGKGTQKKRGDHLVAQSDGAETDWKVGQARWAKIAEPRPNAPYCAARINPAFTWRL